MSDTNPSSKTDLIQYLRVCADLAGQKGSDGLAYVSPVELHRAIELLSAVETSVALTPRCDKHVPAHGHGDNRCARELHHVGSHICPMSISSAQCRWGWTELEGVPEETEDMANIGRALMARLPKGYHWSDCPTEIVTDLQNEIHDLKQTSAFHGLKSLSYRPDLPLVDLVMTFESMETAQVARARITDLVMPPEEPADELNCTTCGKPLDDHGGMGLECPIDVEGAIHAQLRDNIAKFLSKHEKASPADLVGALQDRVHEDLGAVRAGHAVKASVAHPTQAEEDIASLAMSRADGTAERAVDELLTHIQGSENGKASHE